MHPMKRFTIVLLSVFYVVIARATLPQPDLIAQLDFAGAAKIVAQPNFSAFTNEFCSAEAQAAANEVFDKLALVPDGSLRSKMSPGAINGAAQLRPLLDDLLKSEWHFEARDTAAGTPEYVLAIRLNDTRAQMWSKNLATVLESWTGLTISQGRSGTWQLKKHLPPNLLQFSRRGDWVVIDSGDDKLTLGDKVLAAAKAGLPATDTWFSADVNWPRLARSFPELKSWSLPEIQLMVSAPDSAFRLNGKLLFPENLPGSLPAWQLPTDIIHEPITSLTAVRGVASWLGSQPWAQPYEISPIPDQYFIWALGGGGFATYAAVPVPNSMDALKQVDTRLETLLNSHKSSNNLMQMFRVEMTNDTLHLGGVPFAGPYIQAIKGKSGQFLLAGAFPRPPFGQALPPALSQRLAAPNLVYYHWEITAERLPQLLQLSQLSLMMTGHRQLNAGSPVYKWIQKTGPKLGNTVTEVYQTAPDQMSFTRNAPGGLTAFELFALANWLEAPNFPGCDLRLASPTKRLLHRPPAASVPAPATHH
jgi:hypothetical protein